MIGIDEKLYEANKYCIIKVLKPLFGSYVESNIYFLSGNNFFLKN